MCDDDAQYLLRKQREDAAAYDRWKLRRREAQAKELFDAALDFVGTLRDEADDLTPRGLRDRASEFADRCWAIREGW